MAGTQFAENSLSSGKRAHVTTLHPKINTAICFRVITPLIIIIIMSCIAGMAKGHLSTERSMIRRKCAQHSNVILPN